MKKKLNILHLRDSPWVDGPGRTIIETATSIDKSRFNYMIGGFCNLGSEDNEFIKEAKKRRLQLFKIVERHAIDYSVIRQIVNLIQQYDVDILHTHDIRSDFLGLISARKMNIRLVTTLHGWIDNCIKDKILVTFNKNSLRFFDHVIPVSKLMSKHIRKFGVSENKKTVLYNSLILDRYSANENDQNFRNELGVDKETILVGNIGRLNPEKGQKIFISSAAQILREYKKIKFIIIGKGREEKSLKEYIEKLGITPFVVFTGYRKDMISIYNSLDLVVQSSYTEGMPNVILEALLMKVPVIATCVGGTAEIIEHKRSGILVNPGSSNEITDSILDFIFNRQKYDTYQKAGVNCIKNKFDFSHRTKRLQLIYEKII